VPARGNPPPAPERRIEMRLQPASAARVLLVPLVTLSLAAGASACARPSPTPSRHDSGGGSGCADRPIVVTDRANGSTVHACVGQAIELRLGSTYWQDVRTSAPSVLSSTGAPTVVPASPGSCVPGGGCGTVEEAFRARAAGSADLTAHRTTCGEALACQGSEGTFSVHVVVS
jgi:hypothetical protein